MTNSTAKTAPNTTETVLVLDFGAQYGQLIARRVRDLKYILKLFPATLPPRTSPRKSLLL